MELWRLVVVVFYALCLNLHNVIVCAFDFHVLEKNLITDPTLLDASQGSGWVLNLEVPVQNFTKVPLTLNHTSNKIMWNIPFSCKKRFNNPLQFKIISHQISYQPLNNFTVTPFRIFVHGPHCRIFSKNSRQRDKHLVVVNSDRTNKCFDRNETILNFANHIPTALRHCAIGKSVKNSKLTIDLSTWEITSSSRFCLDNTYFNFTVNIASVCDKKYAQNIDFHVTVKTQHLPQDELLVVSSRTHGSAHYRFRRSLRNQQPRFSQENYRKEIQEEQPPGLSVVRVTATDPDDGDAGTFTYSMSATLNEDSENMFAINPISGLVNTTRLLDRETISLHKFIIYAIDRGLPPRTGTASLTVYVKDKNDHAPYFEESVQTVGILENANIGATVLSVRATDADEGNNAQIRYSIINPTGVNSAFQINPTTGEIRTIDALDRETTSSYQLFVQAVDQAHVGSRRSSTTTINISVADENDNRPQFSQLSYFVDIDENWYDASDPVILHIFATDTDAENNALVHYSISGGNEQNAFSIDANTGALSVRRQLDFETTFMYHLTVKAKDSGEFPKTNSTTVVVRVHDVNDNDPHFPYSPVTAFIAEDVPENTTVIQVQAEDRDSGINSALIYSIENSPANLPLFIVPNTGDIKVKMHLDREIAESFSFVVKAMDQGESPRSDTVTVVIQVRDVNDNYPVFNPKVYRVSVSEDVVPHTRIVSVTASDRDSGDNAVISYSITNGNVNDAFSIAEMGTGEGVISVDSPLDYQTHSRYILTVAATDTGGLTDEAEVFINISDTNQHRPVFQQTPYSTQIMENVPTGMSVFEVMAIDHDIGENARITYSLQGANVFRIDPHSGIVTTRGKLDREQTPAYTLSVTAQDNGVPMKYDTTDIEIDIEDVNDNAPEFLRDMYDGNLMENSVVGSSIVQITAVDKDDQREPSGQIHYTFNGGSDGSGNFEIDPKSGIIRVVNSLNREVNSTYTLVAYAIDGGFPVLSTSVEIIINVDDENDSPPEFPAPEMDVYVVENSPVGSTVARITATDPDEGENAKVDYSIMSGLDSAAFELVGRPGDPAIITNKVPLDYESQKQEYTILLRATSQPWFTESYIIIHVLDVNDNPPILKDFYIIFNNFAKSFPIGPIGKIPASDPDELDADRLQYAVVSGNEAAFLHLNGNTGEITLNPLLNSNVPRNGTFQVSVTDGKNSVKATCRLYLRLVTETMLHHSVTIRLNNMTKTAFLSPLFNFFVDALATVMHTDVKNIFVFSVRDDIDVQAQILNVSVSVRETVVKGMDIFYPTVYLQEKIYLERMLLANLSTLQVLPFDDNLCVQELCPNFEVCTSKLVFGSAAPFISSETMLFRPIYPENGYRCNCPPGFTGKLNDYSCDVEVDLCYSAPCQNGGSCLRREGGFTCQCIEQFAGENCEINMTMKYDQFNPCPSNICRPPSYCVPLIKSGFRCEGCPDKPYHNSFCQLTARQFPKGSFLTFPALKRRHRFTIKLQFATHQKNGLLFYNGRFNEQHDFIALEIIDGQVQFSFSLGSNITTVAPYVINGVADGKWHHVTVQYLNTTATVTVGEDCDTGISVKYGHVLDNYTCAARVKHELPDICAVVTKTCHRLLDLTGPLQVGGLPTLPSTFQIQNKDFVGCIKDIYIDDVLLDLKTSVSNNGTIEGCQSKEIQCLSAPCRNGGTCVEGWGTYYCICPDGKDGKDCSQAIENPKRFKGNSYLFYTDMIRSVPNIRFTWYNGISFRTRHDSGVLMQIVIAHSQYVIMKLVNGYIQYNYTNGAREQVFTLDSVRVNDGQWHYFETRWENNNGLLLLLDYGQWKRREIIHSSVESQGITVVYVGAERQGNGPIVNGFVGCIKNVRVGNNPNSFLSDPDANNVEAGCGAPDVCATNSCPRVATCVDEWEDYSCKCPIGTIGPNCEDICMKYNPCENWARCHHLPGSIKPYECECGQLQKGQYCEDVSKQPCTSTWWGFPVCGPCECPRSEGWNPSCNKENGQCKCQENHYLPAGSDHCYPCDCYHHGSYNVSCDAQTGQCQCKPWVLGRRCDQCYSSYEEVTVNNGCEVVYNACPMRYTDGILWLRRPFGEVGVEDCPKGAVGDATRNCTLNGWLDPDFSNCTSNEFVEILLQIDKIEAELQITTLVAETLMEDLKVAILSVDNLYINDLLISYRVLSSLLTYENKQQGLNLTSEQDKTYVQSMIMIMSRMFDKKNSTDWMKVNKLTNGTQELLWKLENYLETLMEAMRTSQADPYEVTTDNIVLGIDSLEVINESETIIIPKYNNIVRRENFDINATISLPPSLLTTVGDSPVFIGYIIFQNLGTILPKTFSPTVRNIDDRPMEVNTPLVTVMLRGPDGFIERINQRFNVSFKQTTMNSRTSPQCVFWQHHSNGLQGDWSTSGCELSHYQPFTTESWDIVCSCSHMTSFSVLMDISETEYVPNALAYLVTFLYVALPISMVFLFVAFILLLPFKRLNSNANSIHVNIIFTVFITQLAFLIGVNKTENKVFCKLVAISLHYFHMSAFSWVFVEMLHMYRMLTEIRNINQGSMKFYYLLGYVLPGIVVGLSVGLFAEGYEINNFCWLSMSNVFIWSFVGPVTFAVLISVFTFTLAVKASCREKVHVPDLTSFRLGLMVSIIILFLIGLAWILGLVSVNNNTSVLHHMYALCGLIQGVFIFLAYIIANRRVRLEIKRFWFKCQGKKLEIDENLAGTRSSMLSRSALAYRHDSNDGQLNRTNVGICTTSTTSRTSTSKSSIGLYKGDDYLRNTSTSTSGNVPVGTMYPKNVGIQPYGYDPSAFHDKGPDDPDTGEVNHKHENDSDSDSELSVGRNSLDLASSHSSDEDDEFDIGTSWEKQMPKSKIVEQAEEQARRKKKKKKMQKDIVPMQPPPPPYSSILPPGPGYWPADPTLSSVQGSDSEYRSDQNTLSSTQPDVTLPAQELQGRTFRSPLVHNGSLGKESSSSQCGTPRKINSPHRMKIPILTRSGSISSDSECSHETSV